MRAGVKTVACVLCSIVRHSYDDFFLVQFHYFVLVQFHYFLLYASCPRRRRYKL